MAKISFKTRLHTFTNETTMHGFKELFSSKRLWLRISWLFVILSSCVFVLHQGYQTTMDFMQGRISISIYPMNTGVYPRPVVAMGVPDWHWINYTKLESLKITPEMLVVIKTFLDNNITWSKKFDVDKTKSDLFKLMKENNLKNKQDLIGAIAYRNLLGLTNEDQSRMANDGDDFTKTQTCISNECRYFMKAYTPSGDTDPSGKAKLDYGIEHRFIRQELSQVMNKYQIYFRSENTSTSTTSGPLSSLNDNQTYFVPDLYASESWRPLSIYQGQDFAIMYTIRVYKYLSTSTRSCRPSTPQDNLYDPKDQKTCSNDCQIQANMTVGSISCYPIQLSNSASMPWPICSTGVTFEDDKFQKLYGVDQSIENRLDPEKEVERRKLIDECIQHECLPTCEQYSFDMSIVIPPTDPDTSDRPNTFSNVFVRYPPSSSVFVTEEKDGFSWFTYISNLGGILGLWLGASMMSFWQTVYLCVYPQVDDEEVEVQKISRNQVMPACDKTVQTDGMMLYHRMGV